jgi:hypothetical protein
VVATLAFLFPIRQPAEVPKGASRSMTLPPLLLEDEVMKLEFLFDIGLIHLECMVQLEGGIDAALLLHADVFNVAVA